MKRGAVPGQRGGGKREVEAAGRKPSPFPAEVRQRIYATEALLPAALRAALDAVLPHGHLPNVNRKVIAQALDSREPAELGERAARRWVSYGYERDHYDGCLRSPIGVVEELLRPTPYCPDVECEDGVNVRTGQGCALCEYRVAQRKRDRQVGREVPTHRPPRLYRDREQCGVCDRPFAGDAPDDLTCTGCRAELERAAAFLTADLAGHDQDTPDHDEDDHPGDAHRSVAPNDEYRQWREQQAAVKAAALPGPPAPFQNHPGATMTRQKSFRVPAGRVVGLRDLRARMATANDLAYHLGPTSAPDDFRTVMESLHEAYWIAAALASSTSRTGCDEHPHGPLDPVAPEGWGACLFCNSRRRAGLTKPRNVNGQYLPGATAEVNRPRESVEAARRPSPPELAHWREPADNATEILDSPILAARRASSSRTHHAALARARADRAAREKPRTT